MSSMPEGVLGRYCEKYASPGMAMALIWSMPELQAAREAAFNACARGGRLVAFVLWPWSSGPAPPMSITCRAAVQTSPALVANSFRPYWIAFSRQVQAPTFGLAGR